MGRDALHEAPQCAEMEEAKAMFAQVPCADPQVLKFVLNLVRPRLAAHVLLLLLLRL